MEFFGDDGLTNEVYQHRKKINSDCDDKAFDVGEKISGSYA